MNLEDAKVLAEDFLDRYNLNHGNAYVEDTTYGDLYVLFEAPRNTTISELIDTGIIEDCEDAEEFEDILKRYFKRRVKSFDTDFEFNELWSVDFGNHNGFTAREFMELLDDDATYFNDVADSL